MEQSGLSRRCVIVAEDEPSIRMMISDWLTEADFDVLEAGDAKDVLTILKTCAADVDVLFTDVNMPGTMDGLELARHVRRNWPSIRLLIASGRSGLDLADMPSGSRFMFKPYKLPEMMKNIMQLSADV